MYYLGIDGGGTKTLFTLTDKDLNIITQVEKGTCHYAQVGYDGLENMLKIGLEEVLDKAKITKKDIKAALGLAGYGRVKEVRQNIEKAVKKAFEDVDYILRNDVEIAICGALGGQDGVVIIAGTGSIGLSLKDGIFKRAGGWGYTVGDEGSAYWIGKKVIEVFSKQSDGRIEKNELYNKVREYTNIKEDFDIITFVNEEINNDRMEIAKFARLCSEAANKGDKSAINIFNGAGKELAQVANALIKDFEQDEVLTSYVGGVFKSGTLIMNPFKENLNKKGIVKSPKYTPDLGAILMILIQG